MTAMRYFLPRAALLLSAFGLALPLGGNTACGNTNTRDPEAPPDPGEIFQEGLDLKTAGEQAGSVDWERVHGKFAEACEVGFRDDVNSPHTKACFDAGVVADQMGRHAKAAEHYRRALQADAGFKPAVQNLTVALMAAGKAAEALPIYEEYLAKNPDDAEMVNNYAGALGEAGMTDKGVEVIQGLLFKDPANMRAYKTLARIYFVGGRYLLSQMASSNALKITPDDADIHNNIGLAFLKLDKEAEAVVAFKEALKLDENNIEANMNLGLIAVKAADYPLAAQSFQRILSAQPGNADAQIGMAVAFRGSADFDESIARYDQVLTADKCHKLALLDKAVVQFLFQKEYKLALDTYGEYSKCHPDDDISELSGKVEFAIAEKEREAAELAEMERQLAELEAKAKALKPELEKMIVRGQRVFQKYAEVEQDPSWAEVLVAQIEAVLFAIESEDYLYMAEQQGYFNEFMLMYYKDALAQPGDEWTSGADIVIEGEIPEGGEAPVDGTAPADAGEPTPAPAPETPAATPEATEPAPAADAPPADPSVDAPPEGQE